MDGDENELTVAVMTVERRDLGAVFFQDLAQMLYHAIEETPDHTATVWQAVNHLADTLERMPDYPTFISPEDGNRLWVLMKMARYVLDGMLAGTGIRVRDTADTTGYEFMRLEGNVVPVEVLTRNLPRRSVFRHISPLTRRHKHNSAWEAGLDALSQVVLKFYMRLGEAPNQPISWQQLGEDLAPIYGDLGRLNPQPDLQSLLRVTALMLDGFLTGTGLVIAVNEEGCMLRVPRGRPVPCGCLLVRNRQLVST